MAFGAGRNRRRVDSTQRKAHVAERARRVGPTLLRFFAVLTVSAGLVYGGYTTWMWAIASPFFGLKSLTFKGLEHATAVELRRLSGLGPGQNLFLLDPAALERAMISHPWLRAVEVRRRFPSSVEVKVEEHIPTAVTVLGDLYLVDSEGEPFKRVQASDAFDLPLITGVSRETYVQDPIQAAAQFRAALALVVAYQEAKLDRTGVLSEVRLEPSGITLVTGKDGQEVRLTGDAGADALSRLSKVRAELDRRSVRAEVIHLDNRVRPDWVAVKVSASASERSGRPVQ